MDKRKRGGFAGSSIRSNLPIIILALLILAGGVYFYFYRSKTGELGPIVKRQSGGFVADFPREFFLEKEVPLESARLTYKDNDQELWNASYVSKRSPREVIAMYQGLFNFSGWETTQSTTDFIYATNGERDVSVKAEAQVSGTKVLISVLNK